MITWVPRAQVGNRAVPANASFLIDTLPPVFDNIAYPWATSAEDVTLSYNVTDGAQGSGVQAVRCRLRAQKLAGSNDSASSGDWRDCASPTVFKSMQEGRWSLQLLALDIAGNTRTTACASCTHTCLTYRAPSPKLKFKTHRSEFRMLF